MSEQAPKFSLYSGDDESHFGEIRTIEKAEQISAIVLDKLQEQRRLNAFDDVATNPNALLVFLIEYDKKLKEEVDKLPVSQSDHLVFAAYRLQKAKAIEQYLYQAQIKGVDISRKKAVFEELKLIAYAEAEQSMATALFRAGDNREIRKEMVALFTAIGATEWGNEMADNLQRLRAGVNLEEGEHNKAMGLMRGVTGHVATIDIMHKLFDCKTYSPSVDIDGRHGIDMGARDGTDENAKIDIVVQIKARNTLDNSGGVTITAVAENRNERIGFIEPIKDKEKLTAEARLAHERELAIGKLQAGMFWLKKQKMESVDNESLVGLLIELRSSQYSGGFNEFEEREGSFDIRTGLCNYALCEAVARQKTQVEQDIEQMRANAREIYQSTFITNRKRRGKAVAV